MEDIEARCVLVPDLQANHKKKDFTETFDKKHSVLFPFNKDENTAVLVFDNIEDANEARCAAYCLPQEEVETEPLCNPPFQLDSWQTSSCQVQVDLKWKKYFSGSEWLLMLEDVKQKWSDVQICFGDNSYTFTGHYDKLKQVSSHLQEEKSSLMCKVVKKELEPLQAFEDKAQKVDRRGVNRGQRLYPASDEGITTNTKAAVPFSGGNPPDLTCLSVVWRLLLKTQGTLLNKIKRKYCVEFVKTECDENIEIFIKETKPYAAKENKIKALNQLEKVYEELEAKTSFLECDITSFIEFVDEQCVLIAFAEVQSLHSNVIVDRDKDVIQFVGYENPCKKAQSDFKSFINFDDLEKKFKDSYKKRPKASKGSVGSQQDAVRKRNQHFHNPAFNLHDEYSVNLQETASNINVSYPEPINIPGNSQFYFLGKTPVNPNVITRAVGPASSVKPGHAERQQNTIITKEVQDMNLMAKRPEELKQELHLAEAESTNCHRKHDSHSKSRAEEKPGPARSDLENYDPRKYISSKKPCDKTRDEVSCQSKDKEPVVRDARKQQQGKAVVKKIVSN